jgi:hypothetical protein
MILYMRTDTLKRATFNHSAITINEEVVANV